MSGLLSTAVAGMVLTGLTLPVLGGGVEYNRRVRVPDVKIVFTDGDANTPGGARLVGVTHYAGSDVGLGGPRDISGEVIVEVGGVVIGGPGSGGGSCGTNLITYGTGSPYPLGPGINGFTCVYFCTGCTGSDVNVCVPQTPSPDPTCMCIQQCVSRLSGGGGGSGGGAGGVAVSLVAAWSFTLPDGLDDGAVVSVRVQPTGAGLAEIDTSDDHFVATVGSLRACGRADLGRQGGELGHDGSLDNNDFVAFIDAFFAGDIAADLGRQGGEVGRDDALDNNDFVAFIDLFFDGCGV